MIKVACKRSSVAAIHHSLLSLDDVSDAHVYLPDGAARPAAFVVTTLSPDQIRSRLSDRIDSVFIPRPFYIVAAIERNETGKCTREMVEKMLSQTTNGHQ